MALEEAVLGCWETALALTWKGDRVQDHGLRWKGCRHGAEGSRENERRQSGAGAAANLSWQSLFHLLVDFVVIRQVVTNIPLLFGPENCEESCLETQPRSLGSHN